MAIVYRCVYMNFDVHEPTYRSKGIDFLVTDLTRDGRIHACINFGHGGWQGHFTFDTRTHTLCGAFNARFPERRYMHRFHMSRSMASPATFLGFDYRDRKVRVDVLERMEWRANARLSSALLSSTFALW